MKKSMIRAIFNGERGNNQLMKLTEKDSRLSCIVSDAYDELVKHLTPEQLAIHKKFEDANDEEFIEEINNHYVEGFKIGLLIGIECMED